MSTFTETWTHANSPGALTADNTWTIVQGTGWGIVSNQAKVINNAGSCGAVASVDTETSDHRVQATMNVTRAAGSVFIELFCRWDTSANTWYRLIGEPNSLVYTIEKRTGGVTTAIHTSAITPATGDVLIIQAVGDQITAYVNGAALGPVTDSSVTTGTRGGIGTFIDTAGNVLIFDNFSIRDTTAVIAAASALVLATTSALSMSALMVSSAALALDSTGTISVTQTTALIGAALLAIDGSGALSLKYRIYYGKFTRVPLNIQTGVYPPYVTRGIPPG